MTRKIEPTVADNPTTLPPDEFYDIELPNPDVEKITVALAGVPTCKHNSMIETAVVKWLRNAGLLDGYAFTVHEKVIYRNSHLLKRKQPDGTYRTTGWMWCGDTMVIVTYH